MEELLALRLVVGCVCGRRGTWMLVRSDMCRLR